MERFLSSVLSAGALFHREMEAADNGGSLHRHRAVHAGLTAILTYLAGEDLSSSLEPDTSPPTARAAIQPSVGCEGIRCSPR